MIHFEAEKGLKHTKSACNMLASKNFLMFHSVHFKEDCIKARFMSYSF